eukprot:1749403-Rhodomonas_salina.1
MASRTIVEGHYFSQWTRYLSFCQRLVTGNTASVYRTLHGECLGSSFISDGHCSTANMSGVSAT